MTDKLTATANISIHASAERVWDALVDPEQIKQYLFGTRATSDWQKGSSITYTGEWNGKLYEDKGAIVDIIPGKILHTTYYSSMSGKEDIPENYANVVYQIDPEEDQTILTVTQDNIDTEEAMQHSRDNWNQVLERLKTMIENDPAR